MDAVAAELTMVFAVPSIVIEDPEISVPVAWMFPEARSSVAPRLSVWPLEFSSVAVAAPDRMPVTRARSALGDASLTFAPLRKRIFLSDMRYLTL